MLELIPTNHGFAKQEQARLKKHHQCMYHLSMRARLFVDLFDNYQVRFGNLFVKYSSLFWTADFPKWWKILHIRDAISFAKDSHKAAWTSLITRLPGNEEAGLRLPKTNAIAVAISIAGNVNV